MDDRLAKHLEHMSPEQRTEFERFCAESRARARSLRDEWWPRLNQLSSHQPSDRPLTRREQAQLKIIREMITSVQIDDRFNLAETHTYLWLPSGR